MPGRFWLLFQQQNACLGVALLQLPGGGQTYDAGADDDDVIFHSGIELTCMQA